MDFRDYPLTLELLVAQAHNFISTLMYFLTPVGCVTWGCVPLPVEAFFAAPIASVLWDGLVPSVDGAVQRPTGRGYHVLVYDARLDRVTVFGGGPDVSNEIWARDHIGNTRTRKYAVVPSPGSSRARGRAQ